MNLAILKILAVEVAGPALAAELYRLVSLRQRVGPMMDPLRSIRQDHFYRYLYRLSSRGLVKIQGLRRQKRVVLTARGLKALSALEDVTSTATQVGATGTVLKKAEKKALRMSPQDRFHSLRRRLGSVLAPGSGSAAFVSYDIPEPLRSKRQTASRRLRGAGFIVVNGSFYVGPLASLKRAIEVMEELDLLPYCCWGRLNLLPA